MTTIELPWIRVASPYRGPRFCQPLRQHADAAVIGEKAHALGRMLRRGLAVPDGLAVATAALEAHLAENDLAPRIAALMSSVEGHGAGVADRTRLASTSNAIRDLVRGARLRARLRDELCSLAEPFLARGAVVVRSSAVGEDSAGQSFAGQLDSILHVHDQTSLERAVLECWSSYWSDRALFYRIAKGVAPRGMGVVIQQQVNALAAGVLFTSTTDGGLLVEYTSGLGDALVAGAVDPGRLVIDRETGDVQHLARAADPSGQPLELGARDIDALRAVALAVEEEFRAPQDVEWALADGGTLYVVQSRPITAPVTIGAHHARGEPPSRSKHSSSVWSNANINENFPGPVSPLLFSIASAGYTHYFRNLAQALGVSRGRVRAMEPELAQIIGLHHARMYYNLTAIHSVIRLAPFGDALAASFDAFVGADGSGVRARTVDTSRWRQSAELAVIAAKATWRYLSLRGGIERFERTADEFAARTEPARLDCASIRELGTALDGFMAIRCHKWLDASLADTASMVCYGALERLLRRAYRGRDRGAEHTSLLKAIPDVVSGDPVHRLWHLSRMIRADIDLQTVVERETPRDVCRVIQSDSRFSAFAEGFRAYLDDWGFRCSQELMLTSPSFQEDPSPLIEILRAYARVSGGSPLDALERQALEREMETERVTRELRGRRIWRWLPLPTYLFMLRRLLPWTHAAIRFRERARLKQALLYSRCRRIALALGDALTRHGVLADRQDVFFFTVTELSELASSPAESLVTRATIIRALIDERRAEHERLAATIPPDAFTLEDGATLSAPPSPPSSGITEPPSSLHSGVGACGGRVTGRATVLRDVTEAAHLARGDVLVTKQTDPGWGPVFFLIAGLVIERGGMLSHGAIIAREFGIPCVAGVREATRRIRSGTTITVDGDRGEVRVVD